MHIPFRLARLAALAPIVLGLAACKMEVLSPSGDVAERQRDLLVQSTWLEATGTRTRSATRNAGRRSLSIFGGVSIRTTSKRRLSFSPS